MAWLMWKRQTKANVSSSRRDTRLAKSGHLEAALSEYLYRGRLSREDMMLLAERFGVPIEFIAKLAEVIAGHPMTLLARLARGRQEWRDWYFGVFASLYSESAQSIEVGSPSRLEFVERYYYQNRPLLIPGVAASWPAVELWTPEYLAAKCGDAEIDVMTARSSAPLRWQFSGDRRRARTTLRDLLEVAWGTYAGNDVYLVAKNELFASEECKVLGRDLRAMPYASTDVADGSVKAWIGPAGTDTPFHQDSKNSLFIQLRGTKQFRLIPPWWAPIMDQREPWYANSTADQSLDSDEVRNVPVRTIVLRPGDGLFIPVGWWHRVRALEPSVSLSLLDFGLPNSYDAPPWAVSHGEPQMGTDSATIRTAANC